MRELNTTEIEQVAGAGWFKEFSRFVADTFSSFFGDSLANLFDESPWQANGTRPFGDGSQIDSVQQDGSDRIYIDFIDQFTRVEYIDLDTNGSIDGSATIRQTQDGHTIVTISSADGTGETTVLSN